MNVNKQYGEISRSMDDTFQLKRESLEKLYRCVVEDDYKGYEPFDGLSGWFTPLAFGNQLAQRILLHSVKRSYFDIRRLAGIKPGIAPQGMAYFARGFLKMWKVTGESHYLENARYCLRWLVENKSPYFPTIVGVSVLITPVAASSQRKVSRRLFGRAWWDMLL